MAIRLTGFLWCRAGWWLMAALASGVHAACPPPDNAFNYGGGGMGGRVFTAANVGAPFGGLVPFTGGFDLLCVGQGLSVSTTAPTSSGGVANIQLVGNASSSGGLAHSAAWSTAVGGPLVRNSTPAMFADAAAIINFQVEPMPLSPATFAVLRIEASGDGLAAGSSSALGSQGAGLFIAKLRTTGASPSFASTLEDSTGYTRSNAGLNEVSGGAEGAERLIHFTITTEANFGFGDHSLQLDLLTMAWGNGFADFGHTARISAFEVATPGVALALPAGLFTVDPANPNRYLLTSAVPEPGSALTLMAGGLLLVLRRRSWQA